MKCIINNCHERSERNSFILRNLWVIFLIFLYSLPFKIFSILPTCHLVSHYYNPFSSDLCKITFCIYKFTLLFFKMKIKICIFMHPILYCLDSYCVSKNGSEKSIFAAMTIKIGISLTRRSNQFVYPRIKAAEIDGFTEIMPHSLMDH